MPDHKKKNKCLNSLKELFSYLANFYNDHKKVMKYSITIVLLGVLVYKIDVMKSFRYLSKVNMLIIIPFLLYVPALMISTIKLKMLLNKKINYWDLFKVYWISNFFSNFLPSTIAGDSYKLLYLRKKFGVKETMSAIIGDRFSGLITLILIACGTSFFVLSKTNNHTVFLVPWTILLCFLIISISSLIYKPKVKIISELREFLININKKLYYLFPISLFFILFGVISLWIYYAMFGFTLNFFVVLGFYPIIQIISMLPISINGLGIREGILVFLFSTLGVPAEISLTISIVSRIIMLIQTSFGGLIYLGFNNEVTSHRVARYKD